MNLLRSIFLVLLVLISGCTDTQEVVTQGNLINTPDAGKIETIVAEGFQKTMEAIEKMSPTPTHNSNTIPTPQPTSTPNLNVKEMPEETVEFQTNEYTIQTGDNCLTLAQKFETSLQEILDINNIDCKVPFNVGQIVVIKIKITPTPTANPMTDNYFEYTAKRGENLLSISLDAGVTIYDIIIANNWKDDYPTSFGGGEIIRIPIPPK